jgi:hypothetical protein
MKPDLRPLLRREIVLGHRLNVSGHQMPQGIDILTISLLVAHFPARSSATMATLTVSTVPVMGWRCKTIHA